MKSLVKIFAPALATLVAAVVLSSCGQSSAEAPNKNQMKENEQAVDVRVEEIKLQPFREVLKMTGTVASFEDVMVPAEEGGKLVEWYVPKGGRVAKGAKIARLDDAVLKAGYEAADAAYKMAALNYERQQKVFEEKAISEVQLKNLEYQRDAAKAQADLAKARWQKMFIVSPINGVVNDRFIDVGEMVGPGSPVVHVVSVSSLKIAAGVPERFAGKLNSSEPVRFTVDAYPGEKFTGRTTFVASAVEKDNRTIPIEVTIPNPTMKLKPAMIADMEITLSQQANSIVIKNDYVQQVDKDKFVVFVDNGGIAEERRVKIGAASGNKLLILQGLKPGDRLITLGFQNVSDGQKIAVQK